VRPFRSAFRGRLVLDRLGTGRDLLDVLQAKQHLLFFRQRRCLPAKAMTLQLLHRKHPPNAAETLAFDGNRYGRPMPAVQ